MTAIVHLLAGNNGPVNDGEKRVLDYLTNALDDDVVLIPNITIPYPFPNTPEENDIIVVTNDAVFVVEVKDLAGVVEITDQEMVVNGDVRGNPYLSTRIKAQKLKGRIAEQLPWFRTMGWVEHVVVLARTPQELSIVESMKGRIVLMPSLAPLVNNHSRILHPNQIGRLAGHRTEIVQAITAGATTRVSDNTFGPFKGKEKLFDFPGGVAWRGEHVLSGASAVLEIFSRPAQLTLAQVEAWRNQVMQLFEISAAIGPSADFDAPRDVIPLDDGAIAVIWPDRERNTLDHYLTEAVSAEGLLTVEEARHLLVGYASAIQHLHVRGWTLGSTPPHNLLVRPNGRGAIVMGGSLPVRSNQKETDLRFLGFVISRVNGKVGDPSLASIANSLGSLDPDKQPSASFVVATLEGSHELPTAAQVNDSDFLERFAPIKELALHKYGRTFQATDSQTKRNVTVKFEIGRPDGDWAMREYRLLSSSKALNESGIIGVVAGDSGPNGSYVATEYLDAPTLATLIDSGELADPKNAQTVITNLLGILKRIHPDIRAIQNIMDSASGALTAEEAEEIGRLRANGIAHNHLDPSNIRLVEDRGVVLTDCVRAAKFAEVIPERSPIYWPPGQRTDVSDPLADLYAVGALIVRMLSRPSANKESNALRDLLLDAALKAVSDEPKNRFTSADEFLQAMESVGDEKVFLSPSIDVYELQLRIEQLILDRKFDEALEICPPTWEQTRENILTKRDMVIVDGDLLLEIDGVRLHHVGSTEIGPGLTGGNDAHEGGVAEVYVVTEPEGGVLEVRVYEAKTGAGTARWVGIEQSLGEPDRLRHAVRSLRISIYEGDDGSPWMELSQAQLKLTGNILGQATKRLVNESKLSAPIMPIEARELFNRFGAIDFGTRAEIMGDTSNRRNYLAVKFGSDSKHLAAIAHFVSRIMPLYKGITDL